MAKSIDREQEIRHSMTVGAKAFAVGAVVILAASLTNAPAYEQGDPVAAVATAPSYDDTGGSAARALARDSASRDSDDYPRVVVPVPY